LITVGSALPEAVRKRPGHSAITIAAVPALWKAWKEAGAVPPNIHLAISAAHHFPLPLEQAVFAQQD